MFGKNRVAKIQKNPPSDGKVIEIKEIFYTLQGEATFSGLPATFIRVAECSLKCNFCDQPFENGVAMDIAEIVEKTEQLMPMSVPFRLAVITGGEPFLYYYLPELCLTLISHGFTVQLETSGSIGLPRHAEAFEWIREQYPSSLFVVCSPKTHNISKYVEPFVNAYKYVIQAENMCEEDGLPLHSLSGDSIMPLYRPVRPNVPIWLSPCDAYDEEKNKANRQAAVESCLKHGYRLTLQIHKLVGLQ